MKAARIVLPVVILCLASPAWAQDGSSPPSAQPATQHVIVPWTHFGQDPPPSDPDDPPSQTAPSQPAAVQPSYATAAPANDAQSAQSSSTGPSLQLYEADISKKHPHPLKPVDLPLADQNTAPLLKALPAHPDLEFQVQWQPVEGKSAGAAGLTAQKAQDHSPEAQIAELTAGYKQREADRKAQRAQLDAASAQDPGTQALVQIEETRLLLQGEKDRAATSQQLAKAFASLAEELDARAQRVRALVENRNQTAVSAEAELNQLNDAVPQRELALRNLAMLPASDQNDQMIRELNAELAQEEGSRKLDEERSGEARGEGAALQAEANELEQAAAEARRKSSSFADAAQSAQVDENLLADRLEYSVARMRGADLLTNASQALDHSGALKDNIQVGPVPVAAAPASPRDTNQGVDQLRDCIRKTGNPDACRAKGDQ